MYLSQLTFNPRSREARRDLASPYELHRTILRAFPNAEAGGPGRVLFRVELSRREAPPVILVQSEKCPDWAFLDEDRAIISPVKQIRYTAEDSPETGGDGISVSLVQGEAFRFRLVANPTVKREGKRHALRKEPDQVAWLIRKGRDGGFEVSEGNLSLTPLGRLDSRRHDPAHGETVAVVSHEGVRIDGMLRVTDPTLLAKTLETGVGSAKGFGFGLLSLARG